MNPFWGRKALSLLLISLFLMAGVGGVFAAEMMGGGAAHDCPYMAVPALCTMSPFAHLSEWQEMFTGIVAGTAAAVLFLLLLFVSAAARHLSCDASPPRLLRRIVSRVEDFFHIPAPLELAFARGLIHTKAY